MNPETLLVEAWLRAGTHNEDEPGCPGDDTLRCLVARQLPDQEARRLTAHLACCPNCRGAVARFVGSHSAPTPVPVALTDLLARGEVPEAWRAWVRGLVSFLPPGDDDAGSNALHGYDEISPPRIDDLGRLIVDLAPGPAAPTGSRVRLRLAGDGACLDLCEITARSERLHAVVDLSAFYPRAGVLRGGVLAAETVGAPVEAPGVLPLLARLQDEGLRGTEFWDRLIPVMDYGDRLVALLVHEMTVAEGDQDTRAPRLHAGPPSPHAPEDKSPVGRVQYALSALEEYASVWRECNGSDLDGAGVCAAQLRAALSPVRDLPLDQTAPSRSRPSVPDPTAPLSAVPRARRELP